MPRAASAGAVRAVDALADHDRLDDLFDDGMPPWVRAARQAQADRGLELADIGQLFNAAADPTLDCGGLEDLFPPVVKEDNAYALSFDEIFAPMGPVAPPAPAAPSSATAAPADRPQPADEGLHAQIVCLVAELQRFTDEFHSLATASQRGTTPLVLGSALFNY